MWHQNGQGPPHLQFLSPDPTISVRRATLLNPGLWWSSCLPACMATPQHHPCFPVHGSYCYDLPSGPLSPMSKSLSPWWLCLEPCLPRVCPKACPLWGLRAPWGRLKPVSWGSEASWFQTLRLCGSETSAFSISWGTIFLCP